MINKIKNRFCSQPVSLDLLSDIDECAKRNHVIKTNYCRQYDNIFVIVSYSDSHLAAANIIEAAELGDWRSWRDGMDVLAEQEDTVYVLINNETSILQHMNPARVMIIDKFNNVKTIKEMYPRIREIHNIERLLLGGRFDMSFEVES